MAFPLTDKVTNLDFSSQQPTLISTSLSGKEQRGQLSSQKWFVSMRLNSLNASDRRELQAFIQDQNGRLTAFDLELPSELADSSAGYTGSITVDGAHSIGDTSVDIDSSANGTLVLKPGDLIRFAGAVKTYMVTNNVLADGSGKASVSISPALQTALTDTTAVTHTNVKLNVRINNDFSYSIGQEFFADVRLDFIEVI